MRLEEAEAVGGVISAAGKGAKTSVAAEPVSSLA